MPNPLLPAVIPNRLACVMVGASPHRFMRDVWPVVRTAGGVDLAALERHTGEPIEPYDYLRACRRLDALRARERAAKAGRDAA